MVETGFDSGFDSGLKLLMWGDFKMQDW